MAGALALSLSISACDSGTPYALRVNGTTLTRSDFEDEIKGITTNPDAEAAAQEILGIAPSNGQFGSGTDKGTPVSTSAEFVRGWLSLRAQADLIHQEFVRRKLTVDPAARTSLEKQINDAFSQDASGNPGTNKFKALPAKTQEMLLTYVAERGTLAPAVT
ncbi:MAG: hypothetical protein JWL70_1033, partial [Acidimicrobiia bacterium]|nr:hypothetical protein [Acidimicrobiia bacterium]